MSLMETSTLTEAQNVVIPETTTVFTKQPICADKLLLTETARKVYSYFSIRRQISNKMHNYY